MLEGKVAVVTGASRGIGKAIALKLASQGAKVVINYNGSEEKAKEVQAQIETEGGKAVIYRCDVSDYGACQTFIQDVIKTEGSMDILVNNAGITRDGLLMKMSEEDFDRVIDTNLKGAFHTIRFAARQMLKQRSGRIINMASVVRRDRKCRTGKLCCIESRRDRTDKSDSKRTGIQRNHSQCSCTGIY